MCKIHIFFNCYIYSLIYLTHCLAILLYRYRSIRFLDCPSSIAISVYWRALIILTGGSLLDGGVVYSHLEVSYVSLVVMFNFCYVI